MKKVIIGIVAAIVLVVAVYFFLPEGPKNIINYYKMQMFDKEQFAEIQVVQNTKVLGQDAVTYGEIMNAVVSHQYWTYESDIGSNGMFQKTITANGDNVTITVGENSDSGIYDNASLQLVFTLDSKGGYDLAAYMNGSQLSKDDRDRLLAKMCEIAK